MSASVVADSVLPLVSITRLKGTAQAYWIIVVGKHNEAPLEGGVQNTLALAYCHNDYLLRHMYDQ